jgi:hypothetical protein
MLLPKRPSENDGGDIGNHRAHLNRLELSLRRGRKVIGIFRMPLAVRRQSLLQSVRPHHTAIIHDACTERRGADMPKAIHKFGDFVLGTPSRPHVPCAKLAGHGLDVVSSGHSGNLNPAAEKAQGVDVTFL